MSTYRITTSDNRKHTILGSSAAAAIEEARWTHRGLTVKEIYSGLKEEDVDFIRQVDSSARPIVGFILHEVPPHDPIAFAEVRHKPSKRYEDLTAPMFDEDSIRRESEAAKRKNEST
jgi:hypothetical protein